MERKSWTFTGTLDGDTNFLKQYLAASERYRWKQLLMNQRLFSRLCSELTLQRKRNDRPSSQPTNTPLNRLNVTYLGMHEDDPATHMPTCPHALPAKWSLFRTLCCNASGDGNDLTLFTCSLCTHTLCTYLGTIHMLCTHILGLIYFCTSRH